MIDLPVYRQQRFAYAGKFDRIEFEQLKAGPQGGIHGWVE
jgi:hypothetical protein